MEDHHVVVGDIRKIYHSVYVNDVESHCHRFLWRNLVISRSPDIYVIQHVNTGGKPAGVISTEAIYKTSAMSQSDCCLLYTSPSPRDQRGSRMPSSA